VFFFFQAEDGIRDRNVTGVQTCALPISLKSKILQNEPPKRFVFEYFGGSKVTVDVSDDGAGGTDLTLRAEAVGSDEERPGWVSVLLALKAAADYNVDIRNHDIKRTWDQGYCDN